MMNKLKITIKYLLLGAIGSIIYMSLEILWRGYTHWTMGILGGICFICLGLINELLSCESPLVLQMLIGGIIITILEFITGCIVNLWLGLNVWDYSGLPGNILGQTCPQFALLFLPLSAIAIVIDDFVRWKWFGEEKPRYKWR